jgi:SAM-dependent methyltransferase
VRVDGVAHIVQVHPCRKRDDYFALVNGPILTPRWMLEQHLATRHGDAGSFTIPGFCVPCGRAVDFTADFTGAWRAPDGLVVPNWRECLRCPRCGLSGRQRRVAELVSDALHMHGEGHPFILYMMEALSPLFDWVRRRFPWVQPIGSEFLGNGLPGGSERDGIRHEDAERLSFADASVDLVVSCDVFEHVDQPRRAFREVARVLRPGGRAILTFPMDPHLDLDRRRAELVEGCVRHLHPAIYHGNPLSVEGALVFTDFGWQVLSDLREAGLRDPTLNVYWSYEHGYLGIQFYFLAERA